MSGWDRNEAGSPQSQVARLRNPQNWLIVLLDCFECKDKIEAILGAARKNYQKYGLHAYNIPRPEYKSLDHVLRAIGNKEGSTDDDVAIEINQDILEKIRPVHARMRSDAQVAVLFEMDKCHESRVFNLLRKELSAFIPICSNPDHAAPRSCECDYPICSNCTNMPSTCIHSCLLRLVHLLLEEPYLRSDAVNDLWKLVDSR